MVSPDFDQRCIGSRIVNIVAGSAYVGRVSELTYARSRVAKQRLAPAFRPGAGLRCAAGQ